MAHLESFNAARKRASTLTQSPKIITKILQERNKVYKIEFAYKAFLTLKELMKVKDEPANARIAAAKTPLEFAGDID